MNTFKHLLAGVFLIASFALLTVTAQDRPEFVILTRTHWNFELDDENASDDEWMTLSKEYLEKVTKKNEFIQGSGAMTHFYTEDNSEVVFFNTYKTWGDIEKAQTRNGELEEAAWPNTADRSAFFKKLDRYTVNKHSDEIYRTVDGAKLPAQPSDSSMVIYMQKAQLAFPEDGTAAEFNALRMEHAQKVIHKNPHIVAYYPMRHAWGADNREFVHVYVLNSLCDVAAMNEAIPGLNRAAWPDETARRAFFEKYNKYFTGKHGDYLYTSMPEVSK